MSRVTVVAKLKAKPDMVERVRAELMRMVEETHKEPGCINYDLHLAQDAPDTFLFYENWESQDSLDKHNETPHFKNLVAIAPEILAEEPEIKLYEMISSPKTCAVK